MNSDGRILGALLSPVQEIQCICKDNYVHIFKLLTILLFNERH